LGRGVEDHIDTLQGRPEDRRLRQVAAHQRHAGLLQQRRVAARPGQRAHAPAAGGGPPPPGAAPPTPGPRGPAGSRPASSPPAPPLPPPAGASAPHELFFGRRREVDRGAGAVCARRPPAASLTVARRPLRIISAPWASSCTNDSRSHFSLSPSWGLPDVHFL